MQKSGSQQVCFHTVIVRLTFLTKYKPEIGLFVKWGRKNKQWIINYFHAKLVGHFTEMSTQEDCRLEIVYMTAYYVPCLSYCSPPQELSSQAGMKPALVFLELLFFMAKLKKKVPHQKKSHLLILEALWIRDLKPFLNTQGTMRSRDLKYQVLNELLS